MACTILCILRLLIFFSIDTATAADEPSAALIVENRHIVVFRVSALGRPPADRVEGAKFRIERALTKGSLGSITQRTIAEGTAIELDGATVFVVTPGDIDELTGETMEAVAQRAVLTLTQAVAEANERRNTPRMLKSAGLALLSTVFFIGAIYGLIVGFRRSIQWLSGFHRAHSQDLKIGGVVAINPTQFLNVVRRFIIAIGWIIALTLTHIWLSFVLVRFPYTRPWGEQLSGFLFRLVLSTLDAIAKALPGLATVGIILFIARFLSSVIAGFFERVKAQNIRVGWLDAETAEPTRRIAIFIIWLFAVAMAYPYLPAAQTDAFKGLSVLLGLMVSIGASGLVGQFASGMILLYARALRRGDFIKIGEIAEGTVTELGLLTTRIRTGTGEEVILPNAVIVANITRNYSCYIDGGHTFILQVKVTIGYATPWRQVHSLLLEAAKRTTGVLPKPSPYVMQTALSDFYIEYKLIAYGWPEGAVQRAVVISDLNASVQDVFGENGVQITSPHYVTDPSQPLMITVEAKR